MPSAWGISMDDFLRWNPSLTIDCGKFQKDHSYCVEAFGEPEEPEPTSMTTTSAGQPGPTQPGQIATCNRWDMVKDGDTCNTFTQKYAGLTRQNLVDWNTEIGDRCQYLWADYYICTGVDGWKPTDTITSGTPTSTNGIATPSPTQPGMVNNCDAFYIVKDGDDCVSIATKNGITKARFLEWNTGVGAGCSSLWLDYYVCVSTIGHIPSNTISTPTTATPTNGVVTPTPTRPGIVGNCDSFHLVVDRDTCSGIARSAGISLAQLVEYNPEIKSDCSGLWADYYICVSIIGVGPTATTTKPTSPTNGVTTPTPIRPGMVDNCDAFHMVVDGDECETIAHSYGISMSQLTQWNPEIKADCSGLWTGYFACVSTAGVDSKLVATTTTTTAGNGIATPTPTRAEMTGNCDSFYMVKSGDECGKIASDHGITTDQLYKWNTEIGSTCGGLWPDYYICVSIVGIDPKPSITTLRRVMELPLLLPFKMAWLKIAKSSIRS
ncbi:hypothetical protein N7481_012540 [Penicillium waksmanii]|uniref:uncharacterized protein n=1 Tax=Penicillium waksmanii TaxID=69791 RepID=UPI0025473270|nr:uncharacterized protein N7481_012540 [Penicillium waksmanii]KAJ5965826.1 hypothetical protein N7481_012540 [Penicillium waksmanii]